MRWILVPAVAVLAVSGCGERQPPPVEPPPPVAEKPFVSPVPPEPVVYDLERFHKVVLAGDADQVRAAIAQDAELARKLDSQKRTALHLAATSGRLTVAELVLAEGVDVNATDQDGYTALHLAAQFGHFKMVQWLIAHGAQINTQDRFGNTPLRDASSARHRDVADLLLHHGAAK
jgi:ankyrin repeat protein